MWKCFNFYFILLGRKRTRGPKTDTWTPTRSYSQVTPSEAGSLSTVLYLVVTLPHQRAQRIYYGYVYILYNACPNFIS